MSAVTARETESDFDEDAGICAACVDANGTCDKGCVDSLTGLDTDQIQEGWG